MSVRNIREILGGQDGRIAMAVGAKQLADAVKVTLGPLGRTVVFTTFDNGVPVITKDGVSVAEQIDLPDPQEDVGAQLLKSAASRAGKEVGDGTTTTTVIANEVIQGGVKLIGEGYNPVRIKNGIELAAQCAIEKIQTVAKPVSTEDEMRYVATISANNDVSLGETVAKAFTAAGEHGIIRVSKEPSLKDIVTVPNGSFFNRGYESHHFLPMGSSKINWVGKIAVLRITDEIENINNTELQALAGILSSEYKLLLIADDYNSEVLTSLVNLGRSCNNGVVAVRSPGFSKRRKDLLEDLGIMFGGMTLNNLSELIKDGQLNSDALGYVETLEVGADDTVFTLKANIDTTAIDKHIANLDEELKDPKLNDFSKHVLVERLAMVGGKVVEITVGAISEVAFHEREHRYDDAIRAVKAAKESGYLPGAAVMHLHAYSHLKTTMESLDMHPCELKGWVIYANALLAPISELLFNAGMSDEKDKIVDHILGETVTNPWYGLNIKTNQYVDLGKDGVIDPAKVTIEALGLAASIGGLFLTTDTVITTLED